MKQEERLSLASLLCTNQYTEQTLKDNLTMDAKSLRDTLLGISYLWHNTMIEKVSQSRFLDILTDYSWDQISEATLRKRIKNAQNWLERWPDVSLFTTL